MGAVPSVKVPIRKSTLPLMVPVVAELTVAVNVVWLPIVTELGFARTVVVVASGVAAVTVSELLPVEVAKVAFPL